MSEHQFWALFLLTAVHTLTQVGRLYFDRRRDRREREQRLFRAMETAYRAHNMGTHPW